MTLTMLGVSASAALGLLAGTSIGCVGAGGIIIVPVLVQIGGYPIHVAIATAMSGYVLTGATGTWVYMSHGTLESGPARLLCLAAMPAALLGSLAATALPAAPLTIIIATMATFSGLYTLLRTPTPAAGAAAGLPASRNLGAGAFAGFMSALTGTGGPAVLIPLLLWADVPVVTTIGLSQAIQLPIATLATVGNAYAGLVDVYASAALGLGLSVGTVIGAQFAHRLNQKRLERLVASVFLVTGMLLLAKTASSLIV